MTPQTPSSSGSDSSLRAPPRSAEERLMVAVRVRPLKTDEGSRAVHVLNNKTVVLEDGVDKNDVLRQKRGSDKQYNFDVVFGEDSTQEEVYEVTTRPLVHDVLSGINATVFAYGATGAGKTHTMVGDSANPGIMVRALNDLFHAVKESGRDDAYSDNAVTIQTLRWMSEVILGKVDVPTYPVTMSYLELYNEQIRDLLNPSSGYLELREDSKGRNIQVAGLSEISTTSTSEVMQLLQKGNKSRTVEPTAMNKTSSRSHALLSVTVKVSVALDSRSPLRMRVRQGRLFMIDLAGSERANKTKNRGKRLQEGAHINRSLLALGNCINALSGGARYVNYRDSKLTRLLKEALGGNCRTVMVAHVSPTVAHKEESRNTLIYADRANHISNKVESNVLDVGYHVTQYQAVINELRDEITRLRTKMQEDRPRTAEVQQRNAARRSDEMRSLREQIVATFKEQMKLRRRLMDIDSHLLGLGMDAERQHLVISHWESRNNKLYKATSGSSRARTQQSIRRSEVKSSGSEHEITEDTGSDDAGDGSSGGVSSSGGDSVEGTTVVEVDGDLSVQHAWAELADIEREQERWAELRAHVNEKLEECRKRGVELEDELPALLSSDDEREILALMCRVHELEADKMALQSERLVRQHELRRRDLVILRYDRQRQLCEEIITRQRQLMEEGRIKLPPDLQDLYQLYQQEIHASAYTENASSPAGKLPPLSRGDPLFYRRFLFTGNSSPDSDASVRTPASSAGSDAEGNGAPLPTLPHEPSVDRVMGHHISRPGQALRFPPLPRQHTANGSFSTVSRSIRQPIPGTSGVNIRKSSSEDMISTIED